MKKFLSIIFIITIIFSGFGFFVYADSNHNNESDSEVVEEFDVISQPPINNHEKKNVLQPKSHITYKITKLGRTSEVGAFTGQSVSGAPGVTISLGNMKATTFSASSNVTWNLRAKAQAALGFNFSSTYTVKHSGTITVRYTNNGRKVKRAEIQAYRLYSKQNFKVTWTSFHVRKPQYYGTYWAKKPVGYHYKVVYYY